MHTNKIIFSKSHTSFRLVCSTKFIAVMCCLTGKVPTHDMAVSLFRQTSVNSSKSKLVLS